MPQLPEDRPARLSAIREQIAAGTYETPDKLEVAVERLLQSLGDEYEADGDEPQSLPRKPR